MSPEQGVIGWDVGGAHLKVAWQDRRGTLRRVEIRATPLWQGLESLDLALQSLAQAFPIQMCEHRVTMTAELVDLFDDRRSGVCELVDWLAARLPPHQLYFFAGQEGFVPAAVAANFYEQIASANWLATTSFAASVIASGVMIDVGSTTSDLLPFDKHQLQNRGFSDRGRLLHGEMIYAGIVRTPLMAITDRVPFKGDWLTLANEHFATTADIYRILGDLPEHADLYPAADGKAHSITASMRRLSRMVGADLGDGSDADWYRLAAFFADRQLDALTLACQRQLSLGLADSATLIGAGVGRFLVQRVADRLGCPYIDMGQLLTEGGEYCAKAADCAPAVALLRLQRCRSAVCA
ncbi:hydantoinase/oxoprolinase family protein [Sedimenticola sp.]|uniref:hydantoinase/oxoprolinase family protein n=1 Tax=Sedimenticola sp. TaxID=1940285 RepID=UPI00258F7EC4|nr:hydantoinase/oxoprolinase family protein [Sedimenticola sp.]MCW8902984.1 S-layer protein [Sedimenticola sp.]